MKSKICLNCNTLGLPVALKKNFFFLGEKSNRMVTITPFMGKLKVHIRQFYVNGNGEIKPGKSDIMLEIEEFDKLITLIPQVQDSIARF